MLVIIIAITNSLNPLLSQSLIIEENRGLLNSELSNQKKENQKLYYYDKPYINGKLYVAYLSPDIHPFFIDNTWENGILTYDDEVYEINTIKYDIIRDVLVYLNIQKGQAYQIEINKQQTSGFYIHGKHFRYLNTQKSRNMILKPGYYEAVYEGNVRFYTKWDKIIRQNSTDRRLETKTRIFHYLYHDGVYYKMRSRRKLLSLLKDKRKELRIYIKNNNIVFSRDNYMSVKEILEYYDIIND